VRALAQNSKEWRKIAPLVRKVRILVKEHEEDGEEMKDPR